MRGEWVRQPAGLTSVVFVHGILSSGESCWRNANGAYWPELLKNEEELEAVGIYVYSYQTGFASGSYSLSNVVDDLKERFFTLDRVADSKKIVFVCHSMGGIVVRKFIVERLNDLLDRSIEIGLYLVASPSLGSDYANWLEPIAKFAGHEQAKALRFNQDNQWLNDLDKTFMNLKESKRLVLYGKELLEDKFITLKLKFFLRKQVVEPFSGARYFGESFKVAGSDHFSIAKPQDKTADQHRLLKEFINNILIDENKKNPSASDNVNFSSSFNSGAISNANKTLYDANVSLEPWQIKLKKNLASQLAREELKPIVNDFVDKLRQNQNELPGDEKTIANFLVSGNHDRHLTIAKFLTAALPYAKNTANEQPLRMLLAYLLQTLVRKCREDHDQGLTKIPVEHKQTVTLIGSARTTTPHIPSYVEDTQEHKNGQRNALFQNIGDFIPENGTWNVENVCQNIAKDLLISLGDSLDSHYNDPLQELADRLSAYADAPEYSPKQGLYVNQALANNPLKVEEVAARLHQTLGELIWIYVYGGQCAEEWLHTTEGKITGLIRRYDKQSGAEPESRK